MAAADDEVCKHYFSILELQQNIVDTVIDQWQPTLMATRHHFEQLLNSNVAFSFFCFFSYIFKLAFHFEFKGTHLWHSIVIYLQREAYA